MHPAPLFQLAKIRACELAREAARRRTHDNAVGSRQTGR